MFCTKCGTENQDNSWKCMKCGGVLQHVPVSGTEKEGNIPNYLVQSILCTLCCCVPFGIVAIIFAAQVNSKLASGDIEAAKGYSRKARMWCWISFALGLLSGIIYLAIQLFSAAQGNRAAP